MSESITPERARYPVLVVDAHERAAVAVIRSLGRAGYPVHASSARHYAMGWDSRFTTEAAQNPPYDDPQFLDWLSDYCSKHSIRCVVPTEDFLVAIRSAYRDFAPLLPMIDNEQAVYAYLSKADFFSVLSHTDNAGRRHLPSFLLVDRDNALPTLGELESLGTPVYVKTDAVHSTSGKGNAVRVATSPHDALDLVSRNLDDYTNLMVQGHVAGVGVGAFLLRWKGHNYVRFMHRRLHELPGSGWSSYRKSWWHDAIMADAEKKLAAIGWQGVAMLEYRWNPDNDDFYLLEMNGRFWGSLHLALYAGVDFPRLLLDKFHGFDIGKEHRGASNVRCRHLALDIRYVWSRLRSRQIPIRQKFGTLLEFVRLTLDPRVESDLWFPGDRRLWWLQFRQFFTRDCSR